MTRILPDGQPPDTATMRRLQRRYGDQLTGYIDAGPEPSSHAALEADVDRSVSLSARSASLSAPEVGRKVSFADACLPQRARARISELLDEGVKQRTRKISGEGFARVFAPTLPGSSPSSSRHSTPGPSRFSSPKSPAGRSPRRSPRSSSGARLQQAGKSCPRGSGGDGELHAWLPLDASHFHVRARGYGKGGGKAPSGPALSEVVGMDVLRSPHKLLDVVASGEISLPAPTPSWSEPYP